jgi:uncharacterized protein (DUF1330 family)
MRTLLAALTCLMLFATTVVAGDWEGATPREEISVTAYLISLKTTTSGDTTWLDRYSKAAGPVLAKHGARMIGAGRPKNIERGNNWERAVLIEFPSIEAAQAFHADPDYRDARELRIANTAGEMYFLSVD